MTEKLVQVGTVAIRTPDGEPSPSIPIYKPLAECAFDAESITAKNDTLADDAMYEKLLPPFEKYMDEKKRLEKEIRAQ